jgi:hypothetical protein
MAATPQGSTLVVKGYRELIRGFVKADADSRKYLREAFKTVGSVVQRDAIRRLDPVSSRSAAGYKVRVRQRGVAVEQSLRKTTGAHPEWGKFQMRHILIPALRANEVEVQAEMEKAMDKVALHFNTGSTV